MDGQLYLTGVRRKREWAGPIWSYQVCGVSMALPPAASEGGRHCSGRYKTQASLSRAVVVGDPRICDLDSTCPHRHLRHFTSVEQASSKAGGLCTPLP